MKRIVMIAAAVWLVAACSPKENKIAPAAPQARIFHATMEATRSYLVGNNVCWEADWDEIGVFDKSDELLEYVYSGETGATQGSFSPVSSPEGSGNALNYVYASYPYEDENTASEGSLLVWFSPKQDYLENSFGACPMVAVSEDENLQFYNLCGFLRIPLYGSLEENIKEVAVYGNNDEVLSGDLLASVALGEEPSVELGTTTYKYSYVYIAPDEPVAIGSSKSNPTYFWVCLPPITFSKGIYVEIIGSLGSVFEYESSNPLTIKRSTCTTTAPLEVEFPSLKSLGKGKLTDGFLMSAFGEDDVTLDCDVYEEIDNPGVYRVTGFQCALAAAAYETTEDVMAYYEGTYWNDEVITVDASNPSAVSIPDAPYGIYAGSDYGWVYIASKETGTLEKNNITFPAEGLYLGLSALGWYLGNDNGTFKITLPLSIGLAPGEDPDPAPSTKAAKRSGRVFKGVPAYKEGRLLDLTHRPTR